MKIYTLKVYPQGWGREVYRDIHILGKESLDSLCNVILQSFGFFEEHLYEFSLSNRMYDYYNYQSNPEYKGQASTKEKIDSLRLVKGQKFSLHYDFGDDWIFVLRVKRIEETDENLTPYITNEKGFIEQYSNWDDEDEYFE